MTLMIESLTEQLRKYVNTIEALEEEKAAVAEAMKETMQEAKRDGLDVKALRKLIKMRKMDRTEIEEEQTTLYNYMAALGMR